MRAMWTGFLTNGLNPKATLFFLSLFTVVINPETPRTVQAFYGIYMAIATGIWFSGVSLFFSHPRIRTAFQKMGHWLERLTGFVLIGLGIKLATAHLD
jgi:threonine/homoserine/homoserine lactone efflux protein